jgi:hypothetical protein
MGLVILSTSINWKNNSYLCSGFISYATQKEEAGDMGIFVDFTELLVIGTSRTSPFSFSYFQISHAV